MTSSPLPPGDSPSLPLVRDCPPGGLRPLMAPGGRENYFSPDLQRLLFGADEPLSRFLPPAKWIVPERQDRSKNPQVAYTVPDDVIKTATPLSTLPRSEIDAFVAAVGTFMAKASLDAKGVPPFVRQCRAEFRLPNPAVDPGAYWVYGPEFDRRLLILWGCEAPASPSLTLEKAVEMIRDREMKWQDKQDLALKIARGDRHLGRFLAPRAADGSLMVNGASVPSSKLKRMGRISPKEWRAFEEAAKGYYARARPEATDVAPFEKELRREFRIPGPDTAPGIYYQVGSHFVIATERWTKETTLPLTMDAALAPAGGGEPPNEPTVSAQLKRREQPAYVRYVKLGAIAAAVLLVGVVAWFFRPDNAKPTLARETPAEVLDASTIVLTFSEPVVLPAPSEGNQPPALSFFGSAATIKSAAIDAKSKRKVMIVTEAPLRDGEKYGISITGIADRSGNVIEPTSAEFAYYDAVPPELIVDEITADGTNSKRLILPFTKPISEASLNPSYFMIYEATEGGRRVSLSNVIFDPETKNHTSVVLESQDEFTGNKWYRFELGNVTDAAARPNRVAELPEDKRRFQYLDKMAPRIREVVATGGHYQIELLFSKPIDRTLAVDLNNYAVLDPSGAALTLLPGGVKLNETGERLTLRLQSGKLSTGRHTLKVLKLADAKGQNPLTEPLERPFQFNDAINPAAPKPKDRPDSDKLVKGATQIDLDFDRGLPRDGTVQPARFRLVDRDRRSVANEVVSVSQPEDNPSRVSLTLKLPVEPGEYAIETNGLSDVFGTLQQQPAYGVFKVKGFVVIKTSLVDWKQPPVLRGKELVLAFSERVTPESAKAVKNYHLEPAIPITKVDFKAGTEDNPTTIVTLQLAEPSKVPIMVSVDGLILVSIPNEGPQSLPLMRAQTNL